MTRSRSIIKRLSRRHASSRAENGERGSALILVLIFMLVMGAVVGALLSAAGNDIGNTTKFSSSRSLEYDAASATNLAIQSIRYTPLLSPSQTLNASPPRWCEGAGPTSTYPGSNGNNISVWCSTVWNPASASTRVVTLSACPSTVSAAQCAAQPVLQAVVTFDDYPSGLTSPSSGQCVVYCGSGITVNSWVTQPVPPTVSGISVNSGPIGGATQLTISGTGFVPGSTNVNFVEERGNTPSADNYVVPVPSASFVVNNSQTITASTPPVIEGSTYFVSITTPTGTSAYGPVFTYMPATPTVQSLSTTEGPTTGGTSITITGTGFLSGASVTMTQESGNQPVAGSTVRATAVSVESSTTITAVTPGVTSGSTYFVTVTTTGGTSSYQNSSGGYITFAYQLQIPTANIVSPSSGTMGGGTSVTISGTGFVAGSTVTFTQINSDGITPGSYKVAASNVNVTSASSITATTPAVNTAGNYFVTVTDPSGDVSFDFPVYQFT